MGVGLGMGEGRGREDGEGSDSFLSFFSALGVFQEYELTAAVAWQFDMHRAELNFCSDP